MGGAVSSASRAPAARAPGGGGARAPAGEPRSGPAPPAARAAPAAAAAAAAAPARRPTVRKLSVSLGMARRNSVDAADAAPRLERRLSVEAAAERGDAQRRVLGLILADRAEAKLLETFLHAEYKVELLYFLRTVEKFEGYVAKCLSIQNAEAADAAPGLDDGAKYCRNPHALARGFEIYERYLSPTADYNVHANAKDCKLVLSLLETVCKSTAGLGRPDQTLKLSSSVKSKSIRLIFGRIDCSHRVLEAQPKISCQTDRIRAH
jgi:hypothetical protein